MLIFDAVNRLLTKFSIQWIGIGLCLFNLNSYVHSQINPLKIIKVPFSDTLFLGDSLWIYSDNLEVFKDDDTLPLNKNNYQFVYNTLYFNNLVDVDTLRVQFRTIPIRINKPYFLYDSSLHQSNIIPEYALQGIELKRTRDWWDNSDIDYSGNYSRGFSIGNNQSLVLNSSLNLQLSGDLGDGIKLTGAISDNQIPVQPEGNTRQIQEFDRLFIQLKKNQFSLTAGDIEINKPYGYFQNYDKRSKGGLLEYGHTKHSLQFKHKTAIGISKGKFNRFELKVKNGNQGPYRLNGRDGESFIIILAGTEKVSLDGQILVRGDDADYIIDYNLGEIKFTTRRLVTDQSRIVIEYEYSDQNYLRSIYVYQGSISKGGWNGFFNVFNEKDSKKPAIATDLDSLDQHILQLSGDNYNSAVRSSIVKAGLNFSLNRVYYRIVDTVIVIQGKNTPFKILVFDSMADSSAYQATFTDLGPGKGHYNLKLTNANGRVYEWVGVDPITGKPLGAYDPSTPLIAPRSQTLLSAGLNYVSKKKASLRLEISNSILDKNRISNVDDEDNNGVASLIDLNSPIWKFKKSTIQIRTNYEFLNQRFAPLNPFRNSEYNRDWNIKNLTQVNEHLSSTSAIYKFGNRIKLDYTFKIYERMNQYNGIRHLSNLSWMDSLNLLSVRFDYLKTNTIDEQANFIRPGIQYQRFINKKWTIISAFDQEKNAQSINNSDSLLPTSFYFNQGKVGVQFQNDKLWLGKVEIKHRTDYSIITNKFLPFSNSDEVVVSSTIPRSKSGIWDAQFSGRNIRYNSKEINDSLSQFYFLSQIEHTLSLLKNGLRIKNIYAVQSGVEPRQEFIFLQVQPGQGEYIYLDTNHDGIRQINEYFLSNNNDTAQYIRQQTFNSDFIQIYQSSLNQIISLDGAKLFINKNQHYLLKKLSFDSQLRFINKVDQNSPFNQQINPFSNQDSSSISFQNFLQQQFFINRANPIYEIQYSHIQSNQRNLLISGTDEHSGRENNLKMRWTIKQKFDLIGVGAIKSEHKNTPSYELQNYLIHTNKLEAGINFRPTNNYKFQINYLIKKAEEKMFTYETATINQWSFNTNLSWKRKLSIRTEIKWIQIHYQGQAGNAVEYIMLDGFKDGNNGSWDLNIDYRLSELITLQLGYSGRKTAISDPLHTGRALMRATF